VNQAPSGYYTVDEAAEHYRTSPETMRYWRHLGKGPLAVKPGTQLLYPVSEIERYDAELLAEAQQRATERQPLPPMRLVTGTHHLPTTRAPAPRRARSLPNA
jgi:hypothetical protein